MKSKVVPSSISLPLAFCVSLTAANAHVTEPRGVLAAVPLGVIVDQPGVSDSGLIRLKARGNQSQLPPVWSDPGAYQYVPDYGQQGPTGLFTRYPASGAGGRIDIDAHSTGNGQMPSLDSNGDMDMSALAWLGVTVVAAPGVMGVPRSQFRKAHNSLGTASGELVTRYPQDNDIVAPIYRDANRTEMARTDLRLGGINESVIALDYAMGLISYADGDLPPNFIIYNTYEYYFSVTKEWADLNSGIDFAYTVDSGGNPTTTMVGPNGGDIYRMSWSGPFGATPNTWGDPIRHVSAVDLGLGTGADVDALDVNTQNGVILFSAKGNHEPGMTISPNDYGQLMAYQPADVNGHGGFASRSVNENGVRVTRKVGLQNAANNRNGEINSVCTFDPHIDHDPMVGTPLAPDTGVANLSLSVVRGNLDGGMSGRIILQAHGWSMQAAGDPTVVQFSARRLGASPTGWFVVGTSFYNGGGQSASVMINARPYDEAVAEKYEFRAALGYNAATQTGYQSPNVKLKL